MQTDPIERSPDGDPRPSHRHQLKRWLLLELVSVSARRRRRSRLPDAHVEGAALARRIRGRRPRRRRLGRAPWRPCAGEHRRVAIRRAVAGAHMTGSTTPRPSDEDQAEQSVLALLLEVHPALLSLEEIVREMTDRPDEFGPRDVVNNAVHDLVGSGLAHRHGSFVFASRAAVRFDELRI
jgi:hypothetical protein